MLKITSPPPVTPEVQDRIDQIDEVLFTLPPTVFQLGRRDSPEGADVYAAWVIRFLKTGAKLRIVAPGPRFGESAPTPVTNYPNLLVGANFPDINDGRPHSLWLDIMSGQWLCPCHGSLTPFLLRLVREHFHAELDANQYIMRIP
jgi:hypothetical protein